MRSGMITLSCGEVWYLAVHQSQISLVAYPRNQRYLRCQRITNPSLETGWGFRLSARRHRQDACEIAPDVDLEALVGRGEESASGSHRPPLGASRPVPNAACRVSQVPLLRAVEQPSNAPEIME